MRFSEMLMGSQGARVVRVKLGASPTPNPSRDPHQVEPKELEWAGGRVQPEGEGAQHEAGAPRRRAHRNLVSGELEWCVP